MNILFGLLQPDEGEIYIGGQSVRFRSPLDAIDLGIGMVHQNRKLVSAHTVLENIILGHPRAGRILDLKRTGDEITELCERYGFKIDLRAKVWQLSEGEKQVVEILKALYRGADVLILDEPTSALAPPETEKLLASIEAMPHRAGRKRQGDGLETWSSHRSPGYKPGDGKESGPKNGGPGRHLSDGEDGGREGGAHTPG
jgi:simple sugar transport system ATP-binding protein